MTAKDDLRVAENRLRQLREAFEQSSRRRDELERLVSREAIARVELVGGHAFYQAGTLRKLHHARTQHGILFHAVELQQQTVAALRRQTSSEERTRFAAEYEDVIESIQATTEQLASLMDDLGSLQNSEHYPLLNARINRSGYSNSNSNWSDGIERILQDLLKTAAQATSRRAA